MSAPHCLSIRSSGFAFTWDLAADRATLARRPASEPIWSGSLLPLFWLSEPNRPLQAAKLRVDVDGPTDLHGQTPTIAVELPGFARGRLHFATAENTLEFTRLDLSWTTPQPPALFGLYLGCDLLSPDQRAGAPSLDLPFWPTWRAEGFAVASAKTNPMQSFFRSWDFGHANLALGSFGPAMGTPYAAAFPRPHYAACAGGRHGWMCFGSGDVPDAALTFQLRARSAGLEWRYREDLWGGPTGATRSWVNPLWMCWADTAWSAYRDYFGLFPSSAKSATHQKSFWGTWGDFRRNEFEWRSSVDRAKDEMEADLICIDDPWEAQKGSCRPHPDRLPTFAADIAYAHERKLGVGIWMPTGWIENPGAEGLTSADLLLSRDGEPVRSNWAVDPHETGQAFFCLDPSTAGTQRFLRERTHRVMRDIRPALLKIDFGYGIPGPDACAPRDPALRGERLAWTYANLIADAAREIDPAVTILGYSLHPLWAHAQDQISLDDLGDAGAHEAAGHGHWSVWASLVGERGLPLMGSSGYLWEADADVLMNSAILGAPGANLPRTVSEHAHSSAALARRRALFRWHRRTTRWQPLWLDSSCGSLEQEPATRNWGRLEPHSATLALTALALRAPSPLALAAPELRGLRWTGRWTVLAQDDASIFETSELAVIPFAPGTIELPRTAAPQHVQLVFTDRQIASENHAWRDGLLTLSADATLLERPFLGFLIRT